jgi:hypothetical protein
MTDEPVIRDLFVWIPKTAGSSLAAWLNPAGMPELSVLSDLLHDPTRYRELATYPVTTFGHIDVDSLIERGDLTSAQLDDCWAFAVVRNPFSRVVSLHRYLIALGWLAPETDLVQFLREVASGVAPVGPYNHIGLSQANLQSAWLKQEHWAGPTHVFRAEELGALVGELRQRHPQLSDDLPVLNESKPGKKHQATKLAIPMIREIYADDFLELGYSFDPELASDIEWH